MTFEIAFEYDETKFTANVTDSGRDFLVNLSTPLQYEAYPTLVFTAHDDQTMGYDHSSTDNKFMAAISNAVLKYIKDNKLKVD